MHPVYVTEVLRVAFGIRCTRLQIPLYIYHVYNTHPVHNTDVHALNS